MRIFLLQFFTFLSYLVIVIVFFRVFRFARIVHRYSAHTYHFRKCRFFYAIQLNITQNLVPGALHQTLQWSVTHLAGRAWPT